MHRFILVSGRTLEQGKAMERGKFSEDYFKAASVVEIHPEDAATLGVKDRARLYNEFGSVVLNVKLNPGVPRGVVFVPVGPWANLVIDHRTHGAGAPAFKGTEVYVEPTTENVTSLYEVLKLMGATSIDYLPEERPLQHGAKRVVTNACCTFCGEVCDLITVELEGDRVSRVFNTCAIGYERFTRYHMHRVLRPYIRRHGKLVAASLEEAVERAVEILANAKYPLIYGLASTCVEATELAVELAELLRGVVDNTSTYCHGPTLLASQEVGAVRLTLGLIVNMAEVVIIWGANPMASHVSFFKRALMAEGRVVKGRRERKIVVVDVIRSPTANLADVFIQVEQGKDYELITALRMALRDLEIEAPKIAGVPREKVYELADLMRQARFGAIVFGIGLTESGPRYQNLVEVLKLVHDLNTWGRWALLPLRGHSNVAGSNQALLWLTGYPFAVDFSRGFPKMMPGVTTTTDLLVNGDVDAALIIASDPVAHFPRKAVEHLMRIPKIVVDPYWSLTASVADVLIPAGVLGIECEGSVYRLDDVPLKLPRVVDPPPGVLCDTEILERIIHGLKTKVRR